MNNAVPAYPCLPRSPIPLILSLTRSYPCNEVYTGKALNHKHILSNKTNEYRSSSTRGESRAARHRPDRLATERFNKCTDSGYMTSGYFPSTLVCPHLSLYRLSPYRQHVRLDLAFVRSPLDLEKSVLSPLISPGVRDQLMKKKLILIFRKCRLRLRSN